MPEPRSIGPVKPSCIARSGVTTPMFTVRCFQMRLSVSSVSYSSTQAGKRAANVVDEIEQRALPRFVESVRILLRAPLRGLVLRHRVRQIAIHAARPVVRGVHARAGNRFVAVHEVFALPEREQEHAHRADVEAVRAEPHEVVQDAGDLVEHHADVLRAHRHRDAEQALDGHDVGVLVAHHRHVVEPVHVADGLVERLRLGEFLGAAMQQADVRIGLLDDLAVHLEHQAQHAVRGRMLRTEVHREIADLVHLRYFCVFSAGVVPVVVADDLRHQRARLDRHRLVHHALFFGVVAHFDVADQREILAERMADETVVGEDAAQVRMAGEQDAEQVERFALEPVGAGPDVDHGIDDRDLRRRRSASAGARGGCA